MDQHRADLILDYLWAGRRAERALRVFALLDAARDPRIFAELRHAPLERHCLFDQPIPLLLEKSSPHLVRLERAEPFTRFVLDEGFGHSWGVFLTSVMPVQRLLAHFRSVWQTRDDKGRQAYFRFYDPRVLRMYMPTVRDEANLRSIFGPVARYFLETEDGRGLLDYGRNLGELTSHTLVFDPPATAEGRP